MDDSKPLPLLLLVLPQRLCRVSLHKSQLARLPLGSDIHSFPFCLSVIIFCETPWLVLVLQI